jgi:hypothetical protein
MKQQTSIVVAEPSLKENLKLVGIFVFLLTAATIMGTLDGFNLLEWIRWFMGGFMIIFGGLKLVGIEVFIKVFPLYDVIARKVPIYKYLFSLIQVFIGLLYLLGSMSYARDITTVLIGLSGFIGMTKIVSRKGHVKLSYLGTIIKLRFSTVTLIENGVMVVLALIMLIGEIAIN